MTTLAIPALLGGHGQAGRRLVGPGALVAPAALLRAQVASRSTSPGQAGATLQIHATGAARFAGAASRLLVEGQRTNGLRNPAGEGRVAGVIGSGGAVPTHHAISSLAGLSLEVTAASDMGGVPGWALRLSGTPAAGSSLVVDHETTTGITVAANDAVALSGFLGLLGGTLGGIASVAPGITWRSATGTSLSGGNTAAQPVTSGAPSRFERLLTAIAGAERAQPRTALSFDGGAVNATLFFGAWQSERGAGFASTPVLPAPGSPQASTRGADLVTASLAALGIGAGGACTLLWSGVLPNAAGAGGDRMLVQVDGGGDANRFQLRLVPGTGLLAGRVAAGAAADAALLGGVPAGVPFRAGIALNGAGRIAASLNGGAAVAATGGPAAGLTTLRLGGNAAGGAGMFGETLMLHALPFALPDDGLSAAVAALAA